MTATLHIKGGDGRGYQTSGSVLVNKTADGVGLNEIWSEIQEALTVYNEQRTAIANLVSFRTTRPGDAVSQNVMAEHFEEATEFGQPTGIADPSFLKIGYSLKDFDLALRSTWKYLRDATAEQITSRVTRVFEADNRLVTGTIMQRLFSPLSYTNDQMLTCYGLWTGDDGLIPPAHMGQTFDNTHTHYLGTNSATMLPTHVESMIGHVKHHGYGTTQAAQFILFMHPDDVETSGMTAWRAGVEVTTGVEPKFDFIVSSSAPAFLTAEHVEGTKPPAEYNGLPVLGSYGGAFVVQSYFIPKGYAALVASGGPNSDNNPVAVREHDQVEYQGLRHIAGNGPYPLQDSYFQRTVGVGIRHRGAAVVCRIAASSTYTEPTIQL
ncbi:hypothetical protein PUR22_07635 [Mycolicibacterium porcinum]|uniref:hypothetical protein n=1 Tax=Mycolicibacterium porcinum TaxID=39693 RepID=UPI0031FA3597